MNRRGFLGAFLYGAFLAVASRIPCNPYGAVFRVTFVDPQGSGMEYSGHLGHFIYNAHRCCKNCEIIFAAWKPGGDNRNAGFINRELTPINAEARRILADITASEDLKRSYRKTHWAVAEPSA